MTAEHVEQSEGVDLASLNEGDVWPLIEQARERVITNQLDALELLILEGLPANEMQAAAWALVQRVRGLQDDLQRVERARAAWHTEVGRLRDARDAEGDYLGFAIGVLRTAAPDDEGHFANRALTYLDAIAERRAAEAGGS